MFQASYTWSHSIDNQSDPLGGDEFDVSFINVAAQSAPLSPVSFAREFVPVERGDLVLPHDDVVAILDVPVHPEHDVLTLVLIIPFESLRA